MPSNTTQSYLSAKDKSKPKLKKVGEVNSKKRAIDAAKRIISAVTKNPTPPKKAMDKVKINVQKNGAVPQQNSLVALKVKNSNKTLGSKKFTLNTNTKETKLLPKKISIVKNLINTATVAKKTSIVKNLINTAPAPTKSTKQQINNLKNGTNFLQSKVEKQQKIYTKQTNKITQKSDLHKYVTKVKQQQHPVTKNPTPPKKVIDKVKLNVQKNGAVPQQNSLVKLKVKNSNKTLVSKKFTLNTNTKETKLLPKKTSIVKNFINTDPIAKKSAEQQKHKNSINVFKASFTTNKQKHSELTIPKLKAIIPIIEKPSDVNTQELEVAKKNLEWPQQQGATVLSARCLSNHHSLNNSLTLETNEPETIPSESVSPIHSSEQTTLERKQKHLKPVHDIATLLFSINKYNCHLIRHDLTLLSEGFEKVGKDKNFGFKSVMGIIASYLGFVPLGNSTPTGTINNLCRLNKTTTITISDKKIQELQDLTKLIQKATQYLNNFRNLVISNPEKDFASANPLLLKVYNDQGNNLLHTMLIEYKHNEDIMPQVRWLLNTDKAEINKIKKQSYNVTALHLAFEAQMEPDWKPFKDLVELLVHKGADINAPDALGQTPMCYAIDAIKRCGMESMKPIIKFLIQNRPKITEYTKCHYLNDYIINQKKNSFENCIKYVAPVFLKSALTEARRSAENVNESSLAILNLVKEEISKRINASLDLDADMVDHQLIKELQDSLDLDADMVDHQLIQELQDSLEVPLLAENNSGMFSAPNE